MSAVSAKKAALAQAARASAGAVASGSAATASTKPTAAGASASTASGSTASASGTPTASASAAASPSSTASQGFVIPPHANYVGEVADGTGSVALVVHDTFAIAYYCNGSTQEAWFKGTPHNGALALTGKGTATLTANYALGHARGTVTVDGIAHEFSIIAVHKPSGLFQSIATVRGATIKAGWIVLPDGTTEVGSMMPNENAANPVSQAAPKLDLSSLTAQYEGTTITATPIDAETGTGF
jgi:hypothetical protein